MAYLLRRHFFCRFIRCLNEDGGSIPVDNGSYCAVKDDHWAIDRTLSSYGYVSLVKSGFVVPGQIIVIAFALKGDHL